MLIVNSKNVSHHHPHKVEDDVSINCRPTFEDRKNLTLSFTMEDEVADSKGNDVRNRDDKEKVKSDCLHHVTMKQSVHSPLKTTPRTIQSRQHLKRTLRHKDILHRIEVVKHHTSHSKQHEQASNQFCFHTFITLL